MKVYLKAYLNGNLGDDLFIRIIANRYKDVSFLALNTGTFTYKGVFPKNVKVIEGVFSKVLDKIIKVCTIRRLSLDWFLQWLCDLVVVIGGSLFIEGPNVNYSRKYIKRGKKYYILGSNFGPYKSQVFFSYYYGIFRNAQDVCFRESWSYILFSDLPNVRYAPDIVFNLDISGLQLRSTKRAVVSVINVNKKHDGNGVTKERYFGVLEELCMLLVSQGYQITLMSFCRQEDDEIAVNELFERLVMADEGSIESYMYNGNIDEALDVLASAGIIIGSRFHANILGLLMSKAVIPIAYSSKTINVLSDLGFEGCIIDLDKLGEFDARMLLTELPITIHQIARELKAAAKHFDCLDKVLKH
jgi:colanic acid/amylovoran biosynthesis protein